MRAGDVPARLFPATAARPTRPGRTRRSRSLNRWHSFWTPQGGSGLWERVQTRLSKYKQGGGSPGQRGQPCSVWSLPCHAQPDLSQLAELPALPAQYAVGRAKQRTDERTQQLLKRLSYCSRGFLWEVQHKYGLRTQESTAHPVGLGFKRPQLSLCFGLTLQQKEHHVLYLKQKCHHC